MSKILKTALLVMALPMTAIGQDISTLAVTNDDSALIINRLKESMDAQGLISVEQHTGRLLFNPLIEKLHSMPLKQKFLLPAMIVNQSNGLKIVDELPFSCFLIAGEEIGGEHYKGFKQYETAKYIRDVKNKPVARVLLCQAVGLARKWSVDIALDKTKDNFIFDEHISHSGQHFFYFINSDGLFEMYL